MMPDMFPGSDTVRSRIAPTPSGFLHLGNAFNFLLTEELIWQHNGELRLRIDDIDADRVRPEYIEDIFESLQWLLISTDQGPKSVAEVATFSQQNRLDRYHAALEALIDTGRVFACNCSRTQIRQQSVVGLYPGTCRHKGLPLDAPDVSWRFRASDLKIVAWEDEIAGNVALRPPQDVGDFIVRRRDGIPAYHIASLCDDIDQDINLIVRGQDLLSSTAAQLILAAFLDWGEFADAQFYHHPLMLDERGEKLSKSAGSSSLRALREAGKSGSEVRELAREWFSGFLK